MSDQDHSVLADPRWVSSEMIGLFSKWRRYYMAKSRVLDCRKSLEPCAGIKKGRYKPTFYCSLIKFMVLSYRYLFATYPFAVFFIKKPPHAIVVAKIKAGVDGNRLWDFKVGFAH